MAPKSRIVLCILLAAAFIAVWWCFWFPYSEERLYAAVPGYAAFVSSHDNLGGRWESLTEGRTGDAIAPFLGMEGSAALRSGGVKRTVRLFAGRKTLSAYVPGEYTGGPGRWIFVTWAGGYSQLLRWNLLHPFVKGLKRELMPNGLPCWIYGQGRNSITITCRDGIVVGVLGDDINILQGIVARIDLYAHGDQSVTGTRMELASQVSEIRDDMAWLGVPAGISESGGCILSLVPESDGLRISAVVDNGMDASGSLSPAAQDAFEVCGDRVDAVALFPWSSISKSLKARPDGKTGSLTSFLNEVSSADGNMFVGIMKGEYSGEIYGLKVPVLLGGVRISKDVDVTQKVCDLMDRLNAEDGLGVIPVKMPTEGEPIIVAGGSKMNLFGGTRDRPALTVKNGWLVVCSDMETLLQVLQDMATDDPVELPRWANMLSAEKGGLGIYVDFASAEQALRNVIAVYTLSLAVDGQPQNNRRAVLEVTKGIVENLAEVGEATASATSGDGRLKITALIGSEEGL